jgi:hypothetical protein
MAERFARRVCANPIRHTPTPMVLERHHIQPLSWGGPNTPDNLVLVCSNCHQGTHTALNALVAYHGEKRAVPAEIWARFHPYYRQMAYHAVGRAGGIKERGYTAAHEEA